MLTGKVLITGGSGFLGRGILRRATRENWPCKFTVLSRDEFKQAQCRARYRDVRYVLGDVTDPDVLSSVIADQDIVIHAAAMKFIPEAEVNVREAIRVNVQGMFNVAHLSMLHGVKQVIGISTDKAASPINVYGMTKALMERTFAELSSYPGDTEFKTVRYGNVIGSTGSLIPVLRRTYHDTGYIEITVPDMTRFWISIDEAVDFIDATVAHGTNGHVYVPMLRSANILRVAYATLRSIQSEIAGANGIKIIGARPGEKLHEHIISFEESTRAIREVDEPYWQLAPAHAGVRNELFSCTSNDPPGGYISEDELVDMIQDSYDV